MRASSDLILFTDSRTLNTIYEYGYSIFEPTAIPIDFVSMCRCQADGVEQVDIRLGWMQMTLPAAGSPSLLQTFLYP